MLPTLLTVTLAATAVTGAATTATADEPGACVLRAVSSRRLTGAGYEGFAAGHVAHADGGAVAVRCYVTVDGSEVTSTPAGSGSGVATTAGRVSFWAAGTSHVELWGEFWTPAGRSAVRYPTTTQAPPQEAADAAATATDMLDDVVRPVLDAPLCPLLASLAGAYGPVTITSHGDVVVDGDGSYDCPPYDAPGGWPARLPAARVVLGG